MLRRRMFPLAAVALLAGIAGARAQPGPPSAIPQPYAEPPPPPPPGARYAWEPGHWFWDGVGWEWHPGRYRLRRAGWHRFVPGHWALRGPGWVWIPAHWR